MLKKILKPILFLFSIGIATQSYDATAKPKSNKNRQSSSISSDNQNMRIGLITNSTFASWSIGPFFEYQFTSYIGLRGGFEYKESNPIVLLKIIKEKNFNYENSKSEINSRIKYDIDDEASYYKIGIFSIPIIGRIYPLGGDFAILLGINIDFLLSGSKVTMNELRKKTTLSEFNAAKNDPAKLIKLLDSKIEPINTDAINKQNENLFNKVAFQWITGIDYTTSFGLIFGLKIFGSMTELVNYNKEHLENFSAIGSEFILGFDVMKLIG